MEEDVRILSGSYRKEGDGVTIELFGRTNRGDSITLLVKGFNPYFYLIDPHLAIVAELKEDEEVRDIVDKKLWVDSEMRLCKKVILTYPWKVPGYRKKYKKECKILAADIPFIQRFIYDKDLGSCVTVHGDEVEDEKEKKRYTTDIVMDVDGFEPVEPFKPDLSILSFDIENSIKEDTIYTICCVLVGGGEEDEACFEGQEDDILERFQQYIKEKDPDMITGYNINGYDIPLLKKRAETLDFGDLSIGRDGSGIKDRGKRVWNINGRVIADAWWAVKSEADLKRETLNHASKELLGEEKEDVNPKEIDKEWKNNPEKVKDYCKKDARLALEIIKELGSIDKGLDIATVSKLPLDEGLNGRTSTLIDSLLIREADRNDIGVPLTSHKGKSDKIKGGYVHSIDPGLYHWVSVLDFKSMYPSIIMENNICFTTLSEEGEIESPTGVNFLKEEKREGLLPGILKRLMEKRDRVKEKKKDAEGKKKRYFDGLQSAIKILMNSFYGVFASSFYRFTDPRIGESITAFARENIKDLIDTLEENGLTVIYSDTDSVFFKSPEEDLEKTIEISEEIAERYSSGAIILEFEKVLNPLFSHGKKKRYVGKVIWPEKDMLVRGYELRRSDSFEAQNEALEEVFEYLLDDDIDGAVDCAKEKIRKTKKGDVEPKKLVISRTCKRYSYYKNPKNMPNVQAAKKMEEKGYEFTPGMKVSWVVIDANRTPQKVAPWLPDLELEGTPDWYYYARRMSKTLARVTEVFGWGKKDLLAGNTQSKLFTHGTKKEDDDVDTDDRGVTDQSGHSDGSEDTSAPKTDDHVSLEDYM